MPRRASSKDSLDPCKGDYVYVLTNEAMPGIVKIGQTKRNPLERSKGIGKATGVPVHFKVFSVVQVPNGKLVETLVFNRLQHHRYNNRREFFSIAPIEAVEVITSVAKSCIKDNFGTEWRDTTMGRRLQSQSFSKP